MVAALLVSLALAGAPVEVQPGVRYDAGTTVQSTELGLSFAIPARWWGQLPPGAEAMVLVSDTEPGMVLVVGDAGLGVPQAAAALKEPLVIDAGTVLRPDGAPEVSGKKLAQRYSGQAGAQALVGRARGLVTDTAGVAFVAIGPPEAAAALDALASGLVGSVGVVARPAPPAVAGPPTGTLAERLKRRKLYYLKVKNGFSNESSTHLCADGTALWRNNHSGMSTGGVGTLTYAADNADQGRWTASGSVVQVAWNDGTSASFTVREVGGSLKVDAENTWVQDSELCP